MESQKKCGFREFMPIMAGISAFLLGLILMMEFLKRLFYLAGFFDLSQLESVGGFVLFLMLWPVVWVAVKLGIRAGHWTASSLEKMTKLWKKS